MISRLVLCAIVLGSVSPAQDIHAARRLFKAATKATVTRERQAGIDALAACEDPRAIDDLLSASLKAVKDLAKLEKKVVKAGQAIGDALKSLDKQGDKGRPVSVGSLQAAERKAAPFRQKLARLLAKKRSLQKWHQMLLAGCGILLDSIADGPRGEAIASQVSKLSRTRDLEERKTRLAIVAQSQSPAARDALVELAKRVEDGVLRVAVIDAIAARRDVQTIPTLADALEDDVWPVRVAAARGLAGVTSIDCIPPLIACLASAEGRFLEEVLEALISHAGVTFHDNDTLWRLWWKDEEKALRTTLEKISSGSPAKQLGGMIAVGQNRFLLGARRLLAQEGLGPLNADEHDLEPATTVGSDVVVSLAEGRRDAVGRVFTQLPANLRSQLVSRFLIDPLQTTGSSDARVRLISFLGGVRTERARQVLRSILGKARITTPGTDERLPSGDRERMRLEAARAMGRQGHEAAARALREALTGFSVKTEVRVAAARSLRKLNLKACVFPLIMGLGSEDKEVRDVCGEALVAMTGLEHGSASAWGTWWETSRAKWEPKKDGVAQGPKPEPAPAEHKVGTRFYGIETRSKHIVFILDRSGSMQLPDAKGQGSKISVAKNELTKAITSLPDNATFNIIFYNSTWDVWRKKMAVATLANRKKAVAWVKGVQEVGATNIFDPLERAFQLAGRGTHDKTYKLLLDTIFFMSDGLANRGRILDPRQILKEIEDMNALKKVRIHSIGIGPNHDVKLMKGLADMTGGSYVAR
ncbi:MAG: HEAT repeat domain-containing protein [Planctomycetes bacterium]|nr:HEAT repeat domain-containing protein [Planctomycetota bacterium]